jgi:hypothetical protein
MAKKYKKRQNWCREGGGKRQKGEKDEDRGEGGRRRDKNGEGVNLREVGTRKLEEEGGEREWGGGRGPRRGREKEGEGGRRMEKEGEEWKKGTVKRSRELEGEGVMRRR